MSTSGRPTTSAPVGHRHSLHHQIRAGGGCNDQRAVGRDETAGDGAAGFHELARQHDIDVTNPGRERQHWPRSKLPRREERSKFDQRGKRPERERDGRGEKPSRDMRGRGNDGDVTRVYIPIGRKSGVRPGDLVGAIANEAGLDSRDIGAIEIADKFSLVEVPESVADTVIRALRGTTIRGKRVMARRDGAPH